MAVCGGSVPAAAAAVHWSGGGGDGKKAGIHAGAPDEASPGLAAFLCVLGIYALAGTGLFLLCRLLCREVGGFLHQLPELAGRLEGPAKALQDRLYAIADKFPDGVGSGLRAGLTSFFESGAGFGAKLYERLFTLASGFLGKLPIWCSAR
ncbi:MAG: hypothetical protein V8T00_06905 [Oscillospiraceae bacterium]